MLSYLRSEGQRVRELLQSEFHPIVPMGCTSSAVEDVSHAKARGSQ